MRSQMVPLKFLKTEMIIELAASSRHLKETASPKKMAVPLFFDNNCFHSTHRNTFCSSNPEIPNHHIMKKSCIYLLLAAFTVIGFALGLAFEGIVGKVKQP